MQVCILGAFLAQGNQEEETVWGLRKLEKQSVNASVSQMDFFAALSGSAHIAYAHTLCKGGRFKSLIFRNIFFSGGKQYCT